MRYQLSDRAVWASSTPAAQPWTGARLPALTEDAPAETPILYVTSGISSEGLIEVYPAQGREATGENVAGKIKTGGPGSNDLWVERIGGFVHSGNGSSVERDTVYGGPRPQCNIRFAE